MHSRIRKNARKKPTAGNIRNKAPNNKVSAPCSDKDATAPRGRIGNIETLIQMTDRLGKQMQKRFEESIAQINQLKGELAEINALLDGTQQEIATLSETTQLGGQANRAKLQLDAVVSGAEGAAQQIMTAAEKIDEAAGILATHFEGKPDDPKLALTICIHENITNIFEACNFQDLTGQRITKVMGALAMIEERIAKIVNMWNVDTQSPDEPSKNNDTDDNQLLRGPAVSGDSDNIDQNEIDRLFS